MKPSLLDTAVVEKLLEGHPDVLTPKIEADDRWLAGLHCPKCNRASIVREIDKQRPFVASDPLVRWNGRCLDCKCLFSPATSVIVEG